MKGKTSCAQLLEERVEVAGLRRSVGLDPLAISAGVARRSAGVAGSTHHVDERVDVRCPSARIVSASRASGSSAGLNGLRDSVPG